mgnify:CR=1 FL=1
MNAPSGLSTPFEAEFKRPRDWAFYWGLLTGLAKTGSDIDIVVEFTESPDIFAFLRLREYLSRRLNGNVDLVSKRALHPAIRDRILSEAIYV